MTADRWVLVLALALAALAGWRLAPGAAVPAPTATAATAPQRILSCSPVADAWLPDLVEPGHILGTSAWFRDHHPLAFRIAATAAIVSIDRGEAIRALAPDLVVVSDTHGDPRRVARLRDAGLTVLDLGASAGRSTAGAQLRALGSAVGSADRADALARTLERRLAQAGADIPAERRPRAVVAQVWGDDLSLATLGSSAHDALVAGGCIDAAAERWRGWPRIAMEDLAALDPAVIVCAAGHADRLRRLPGAERVAALHRPGGVVELAPALLEDPGRLLADAAEAIRAAVHGEPGR
jgi:iron complex transport system substrate-binding protein